MTGRKWWRVWRVGFVLCGGVTWLAIVIWGVRESRSCQREFHDFMFCFFPLFWALVPGLLFSAIWPILWFIVLLWFLFIA